MHAGIGVVERAYNAQFQGGETLKKTLKERTTVILPADAEPFKLLKEMPQIEPK